MSVFVLGESLKTATQGRVESLLADGSARHGEEVVRKRQPECGGTLFPKVVILRVIHGTTMAARWTHVILQVRLHRFHPTCALPATNKL